MSADCSSYLDKAFRDRDAGLKKAKKVLKPVQFDTIACRGISGVVFASALALRMKKHLMVIRKDDGSHASQTYESTCARDEVKRWLFVDDFVDSGKTRDIVKDKMAKLCANSVWTGSYLYQREQFYVPNLP